MIDFAFTAEQEDFRKELRRFAVTELAPRYRERAARSELCWTAHRQLAELGVLGLGLPEKFGGTGEPDPITLGLATRGAGLRRRERGRRHATSLLGKVATQ